MKIDNKYKFTEFFEKGKKNKVRKIEFLVFHHIETVDVKNAVQMLQNHEVSSHYLIDKKGKIFLLVDEKDVAYHAGKSFFNGFEGLNKNSIGIEFLNDDAKNNKFTKKQLKSGLELSLALIKKYKIKPKNIVAHSDIAYYDKDFSDVNGIKLCGFLNRKQDPSHQFDWRFFFKNKVGIYPKNSFKSKDEILYRFGDVSDEILEIKEKLAKFGYKITQKNNIFDLEMMLLTRVFNRRFNQKKYQENSDIFWLSSLYYLNQIIRF